MNCGPGSKVQSCHVPPCSRPKGPTRAWLGSPESRMDACGDVTGMDFGAWSGRNVRSGRNARRGGFTLMEVIVGLVVASLTIAAGFATLAFVSERSAAAEVATSAALEGAAGRTLLVEWLSSARLSSPYRDSTAVHFISDLRREIGFEPFLYFGDVPVKYSGSTLHVGSRPDPIVLWRGTFEGREAEEHALAHDELVFPTAALTPLHAPYSIMRLYIDEDEATPERGLVAELTERPLEPPRRAELAPQVAHMEIRYLPDVEGAVDDLEWVDGWSQRNHLPRAVEITLFPAAGDSLPPLLRYPLRVPVGTLR
jgi:prepilin-type N-terminal cleavage/methylation domain-containing protein